MSWNGLTAWDRNRPLFIQVGIIISLIFTLVCINFTGELKIPTPFKEYESDIQIFSFSDQAVTPETEKKTRTDPNISKSNFITVPVENAEATETVKFENSDNEVSQTLSSSNPVTNDPVGPVFTETPEVYGNVFTIAEMMPYLKTCAGTKTEAERRKCTQEDLISHIYKNLRYPSQARESGIEGTVVVGFIIDQTGHIVNVEILREIGGGCGQAVLNAVNKLVNWNPGMHNGRPVNVKFTLPVKFRLQN